MTPPRALAALLAPAFALAILAVSGTARAAENTLVIAPSIFGVEFCPAAVDNPAINSEEEAGAFCAGRHENSAARIRAFLDEIGPVTSPSGHFKLGYELDLPLMRYFKKTDGVWAVDRDAIRNRIATIAAVERPVVVYLSANHFTDGGLTLSGELAHDPTNLMWSKGGPLRADGYFMVSVNAWTLTDFKAPINAMREAAFRVAIDEICRLPEAARSRIVAVSLLGEVQQLYPDFLGSTGYDKPFEVTDYAPLSIAGFRTWLKEKFGDIDGLNRLSGTSFRSFDEVAPPSKDIHKEILNNYWEHLDAYAAGSVPIYGWAYDLGSAPVRIAIYLDGRKRAEIPANLSRSDVPEAEVRVKTPNVGWRYDFDYRAEAPGVHTLDILATRPGRPAIRLTTRQLSIAEPTRRQLTEVATTPVEGNAPETAPDLLAYVDGPVPLASLFYNPLARLWLDYRNVTVTRHIEHFAEIAQHSCLPPKAIFSHQLTPELNASWNGDLMAVADSQRPNPLYRQGATLYAGAAFGQAFFDWKNAQGWTAYSVAELHPRVALSPDQYLRMFDDHRRAGAVYIAPYFMSIVPNRIPIPRVGLARMWIAPETHTLGSDSFYAAIADTINHH